MASDIIDRLRDRERLCLEGVHPLVQACEAAADEITHLRAALAEAQKKLADLEDSEACEAITLRTKLAEAERERDQERERAKNHEEAVDGWIGDFAIERGRAQAAEKRAERAEADLAEARRR